MFSIKADLARFAIGVLLCLTGFWPAELIGSILVIAAVINFILHACRPDIVRNASATFNTKYPSDPVAQERQLALIRGNVVPGPKTVQ